MTKEAADAAQKNADLAWAEHEAALTEVRTALRNRFDAAKAATGMNMGPQLDAATSLAIGLLVDHASALTLAHDAKARALNYQDERDQITTALPPPPPAAPAPKLEQGDPAAIRDWLQHASAKDVVDALNEIADTDARVMWAVTMLGWVRQDGNTADVIAVLRAEDPKTEVVQANPDEMPGQ